MILITITLSFLYLNLGLVTLILSALVHPWDGELDKVLVPMIIIGWPVMLPLMLRYWYITSKEK